MDELFAIDAEARLQGLNVEAHHALRQECLTQTGISWVMSRKAPRAMGAYEGTRWMRWKLDQCPRLELYWPATNNRIWVRREGQETSGDLCDASTFRPLACLCFTKTEQAYLTVTKY